MSECMCVINESDQNDSFFSLRKVNHHQKCSLNLRTETNEHVQQASNSYVPKKN